MKIRTLVIILLVIFLIIIVIGFGLVPSTTPTIKTITSESTKGVNVNFEFKTIDDKTMRISDFKGKIVLIDFWATWCRPCVATMRELKKVYERYGDKIVIISISLNKEKNDVIEFINKEGIKWIIGWDPKGDIARKFNIKAIPTLLIVNKDGILVKKVVGYHTADEIIDLIRGSTGENI